MELITNGQVRRKMAMIIAIHDRAAVASLADRAAVLYGALIVEDGPGADIYQHPYAAGPIGSIPGIRRG
jgi:ABC-type dipeptide/oligopeptide/nickel transport system ATPase component